MDANRKFSRILRGVRDGRSYAEGVNNAAKPNSFFSWCVVYRKGGRHPGSVAW